MAQGMEATPPPPPPTNIRPSTHSMSRTFVMLGRMGLVPPLLSSVHPKTQTPIISVLFCGCLSALLALFVPIGQLADLTSLGALFAFCVVCSAVLFRCVMEVGLGCC